MIKSEKFNKAVEKYVNTFNPTETTLGVYRWTIPTSLGYLEITVHEPEKRQKLFSVFMKFQNVDKAKVETICNSHSGKWNIHISNFEGALEELKIRLAGIGVKAVVCEDCGDGFHPDDLIPYKYEPSVKLCENCNETRATEDES